MSIHSTPVLLTQQTQSREHMHAVTHTELGQRQLLTFEATQSSIVDVNEQYLATRVQSVPTLSLLENVRFDNATEVWTLTYETMAVDSSVPGQINHYHRVLYLTRAGHQVGASDTSNPCLQPAVDYAACLSALRAQYVVLETGNDLLARDRIETTSWLCAECPSPAVAQEFVITVASFKFVVDGAPVPVLNLVRGGVYTFIQSDNSNANHPLRFKDESGIAYTEGVTFTGTPGQLGARTVISVAANAPVHLRYYCSVHGDDMGNTVSVSAPSTANIVMTVQPRAFSSTQSLQLQIPHSVIRFALARQRNSTRADSAAFALLGAQAALDFGVGMMFIPHNNAAPSNNLLNNLLIFDMFTVLENTFEQLAMMTQTSYSIATHVAFWTAAAQSNAGYTGTFTCEMCEAGKYKAVAGAALCTNCDAGKFSDSTAASSK